MFIASDSYELGAHLNLDDVHHKKLDAISIFCEKKNYEYFEGITFLKYFGMYYIHRGLK